MITMTRSGSVRAKIPTESPQPFRKGAARAAGRPKAASSPAVLAGSTERAATRGGGEVIELECGDTLRLRPRPPGSRAERYPWTGKRRETILTNESGPEAGVEGVVEDVKGRAKEAAGAVSGNESLKQEGQAQQDKAAAQRDVAAKEAEAEKARVQASAAEAEQRSHQQNP
jgi:uncharacterized protein YjbJ (UPF0337 family)